MAAEPECDPENLADYMVITEEGETSLGIYCDDCNEEL